MAGVKAEEPPVIDKVCVAAVAKVLLHDPGPDEEPRARQVEDESPVLLDVWRAVGRHHDRDDTNGVHLVLFAHQGEDAQDPHRDPEMSWRWRPGRSARAKLE